MKRNISKLSAEPLKDKITTNLSKPNRTDKDSLNKNLPRILSLFCGAGGLDLGFVQEGFEVILALDLEISCVKTHKRNFSRCSSHAVDLNAIGPKGVVNFLENEIAVGENIGIIGGPPCQGFSRSNPLSDPDDPRNRLPQLYVDIIKGLQQRYVVDFVVFENVLGMKDKKHFTKYQALLDGLKKLKFDIYEKQLCALDYGVPQKRERLIVSALRKGSSVSDFIIEKRKGKKTVRDAIGNLAEPIYFQRNLNSSNIPVHQNHWTMQPRSYRFQKPLINNNQSRSFRKLHWDKASPTIAFGNREIHVHPEGKRRLSIYEAMLLQGFPRSFVLEGNLSEQVTQISNAVPPPLARSIAATIKKRLEKK